MNRLSAKQFNRLSRNIFGEVLEPFGFTSKNSRRSIFWRKFSNDIYHFIMPDPLNGGPKYDIHVFPTSPLIDNNFAKKFPDYLGVVTDSYGYLHSKMGVGSDQELYSCNTEEDFIKNFDEKVKPALLKYAVPFLNNIRTIEDMAKIVKKGPYAERIAAVLQSKT